LNLEGVLLDEKGLKEGEGTLGPNDLIVCVSESGLCMSTESLTTLNLPWNINLELMASEEWLAVFAEEMGKAIRWLKECQTLVGKITDECSWNTNARLENSGEGVVLGIFNAESEGVQCTLGKVKETLLEGQFSISEAGSTLALS
jgi:hypothetical protein